MAKPRRVLVLTGAFVVLAGGSGGAYAAIHGGAAAKPAKAPAAKTHVVRPHAPHHCPNMFSPDATMPASGV
jgi:hypothetical protein